MFDFIRGRKPSAAAVPCAFDLLELDGEDLRREPIEPRKSTLKSPLRGKHAGIALTRTSSRMARSSTVRLVRPAARASSRSASAPPIGPDAPIAG